MNCADLTILYRGPLASCNYGCGYCPFAKRPETAAEKEADTAALTRFLDWCDAHPGPLSVFFTPWGEALHHARYREAVIRLSRMPLLSRVAAQTNLAGSLEWLQEADTTRVGLWATFHPTEVSLDRFVRNVLRADELGASVSAGVVGMRSQIDDIEELRAALPEHIPVWVNAYSVDGGPVRRGYYRDDDIARLRAVDPYFEVGLVRFASRGRTCGAGSRAITVDGDGTVHRCHFVPRRLGNLYTDGLDDILTTDPCPKPVCDCHIGYVHLDELAAHRVYGEGLLERVPRGPEWADPQRYLDRAQQLDLDRGTKKAPPVPGRGLSRRV